MERALLKVIVIVGYGLNFGFSLEASLGSYLDVRSGRGLSQENILLISALQGGPEEDRLNSKRDKLKDIVLEQALILEQEKLDNLRKAREGYGKYILGAVMIVLVCGGGMKAARII